MTFHDLLVRGWVFVACILPCMAAFSAWRAHRRDVPWAAIWLLGALAAAGVGAIVATSNDLPIGRYITAQRRAEVTRSWEALSPGERTRIRLLRGGAGFAACALGIGATHAAWRVTRRAR
ncbi:MAG: hypothetical protein SFY69_13505 [Planctomycetota bacterium]|nr:hypothetical protein [Planctomycetota bacterium]